MSIRLHSFLVTVLVVGHAVTVQKMSMKLIVLVSDGSKLVTRTAVVFV